MKISDEILGILSRCTVDGNTLYLPDEQLDRKTYTAVNKCLVNIGGKWNRKAKGHVFDHDPSDDLDSMLLTGETVDMKKVYQFFPTPKEIAQQMCQMAELDKTCIVLEPFSKHQDVDHILAAYNLLAPGGVLVSVVSPSPFFRTDKKSVLFQNWMKEVNAEVVDVPEGAFKESGTMITTKIIKAYK